MGKIKYLLFILFGLICLFLGTQKTLAADSDIIINEVMANAPTPETDLEWVELYNRSQDPIDLKNWTFDGKVISASSLVLNSEEYLIIARNSSAFLNYWPTVSCQVVQLTIALTNSSDTVILKNFDGSYQEQFSWISDPGDSRSWERIDPKLSTDDNWASSLSAGGTPGEKNSVSEIAKPKSPELLSPTDYQIIPFKDQVEFTWNSDDLNVQYEFLLGQDVPIVDPIISESNLTQKTYLVEDLEAGVYYWQVIASNQIGKTASPVYKLTLYNPVYSDAIIVNELMPDPSADETKNEWIELYNNSSEAVDLNGWCLKDTFGNIHVFTIFNIAGTIIGPHQFLLFYRSQTGITLNNDIDGVALLQPNGNVLSQTPNFFQSKTDWSWARTSGGEWVWTTKITPAAVNIIVAPQTETDNDTDDDEEDDIPKNTVPIEIKTGEARNFENYLVKITGTVMKTSGNTFYLDDGSGQIKVYIQDATGIDKPEMHTGDIFQVTGIVNYYRNLWRILPQKQDDIILVKAKEDENQTSTTKAATVKSSTASKAKTALASTAKARAPTEVKKIASAKTAQTQVEGYKSPLWVEIIKTLVGLSLVFLVILGVKLWRLKKDSPRGSFGDDLT